MAKVNVRRRQARERGDKLYTPDSPCKNGHIALCYASNGSCAQCLAEKRKIFGQKNKNGINERRRLHRQKNPDLYEEKKKQAGFKRNVAIQSKRRVTNGSAAFIRMTGKMVRLNRIVRWDEEFTSFVCKEAHHLARMRDAATNIKWSVDHIVPINGKTVSGLHVWNNLQVIPMQQNRLKHTKLEI